MDHYINKHKRADKDPNQIEFEKQQKECTFKPTILPNSDRATPNLVDQNGKKNFGRSPARITSEQADSYQKKYVNPQKP
jgi:hypothetical protein